MAIGDFLGGRDHTTIMHGVDKVGNDLQNNSSVKQDILNVKQLIYSE